MSSTPQTFRFGDNLKAAWTFTRALAAEHIPAGYPSLTRPYTVRTLLHSDDDARIADLESSRLK